jgi:hypothetical protein
MAKYEKSGGKSGMPVIILCQSLQTLITFPRRVHNEIYCKITPTTFLSDQKWEHKVEREGGEV